MLQLEQEASCSYCVYIDTMQHTLNYKAIYNHINTQMLVMFDVDVGAVITQIPIRNKTYKTLCFTLIQPLVKVHMYYVSRTKWQ